MIEKESKKYFWILALYFSIIFLYHRNLAFVIQYNTILFYLLIK